MNKQYSRPAKFKKTWIVVGFIVAVWLGSLPLPSRAFELDDFSYDLQLIEALNQAGLINFATFHINLLKQRYPDRLDHIHYAQARFHFSRNQRRLAREALEKIPNDSPFYLESFLLNARQSIQRGDLQDAAASYEQYFAQVEQPASNQPDDVEIFREAVLYYAQTKIEEGNPREVVAVLQLLNNLPANQAPQEDGMILTIGEAIFSALENRLDRDLPLEPEMREMGEAKIERLLDLQWRHGGLSRLTVQAFMQAARGYILLDQPERALRLLQDIGEPVGRLEREQPDQPSLVPVAFYYYARAYEAIGRQRLEERQAEQAEQALLRAATFYSRRLLERYAEHPLASQAQVRYLNLATLVEEHFDASLPPLRGRFSGGFPLKVEEADRLFNAGRYQQALPLYLEALRMDRHNRRMTVVGQRMINAYGELGQLLEAAAVASYLADYFPDQEETANALLLAGRYFFRQAEKVGEESVKARFTEQAISVWNRFIEIQPGHFNAASIAFFIAEYHYARGLELVGKARSSQPGEEREQKHRKALDAFARAIPYYQRMLDQYADTPEGVRAYYKLGWVYYNLDRGREAAELFIRYSNLETAPGYSLDRLRAKLHAGEQLMFADQPALAIAQLTELQDWYRQTPTGLDLDSEEAARIREDGANYLAWAYDLTAETVRPELRDLDHRIAELKETVQDIDRQLQELELRQAGALDSMAMAEQDWEEVVSQWLAPLPDPELMARDEVMPSEADLAGVAEGDRQRMIANAQQRANRLAEEYRNRLVANYQGQIRDSRETRGAWRNELDQIEKQLVQLQAELDQPQTDEFADRDLLDQRIELLNLEKAVAENYLDAKGQMINLLEIAIRGLQESEQDRSQFLERQGYQAQLENTRNYYTRLRDKRQARARLELKHAEDGAAMLAGQRENLQAGISELRTEREPVFARLKEKKEKAISQFKHFLEEYPRSRYVPEQMARVGLIYLELENFEEAVNYLEQLARDFPDHQVTNEAIFDLGRAQFEINQIDQAIATFKGIADHFAEQNLNNLEYIARTMLQAGDPLLSLAAYDELLNRAQDQSHPDYPELYGEQGRYRERLLNQASNAALAAQLYDRVIELAESLLEANERTAYFFQIQMNIAEAAREREPPDFTRAEQALGQIARFAQEESLKNKALVEYGKTSMMNEARGPAALRRALSQFSQLVMIDDHELVMLADLDDPEIKPFVEEAIYYSAVCHALLGNQSQRDLLVDQYRQIFPDGQFLARINTLPGSRY